MFDAWTKAKEQIRLLADEACNNGLVDRSGLIRNLHTELRIANFEGNALV